MFYCVFINHAWQFDNHNLLRQYVVVLILPASLSSFLIFSLFDRIVSSTLAIAITHFKYTKILTCIVRLYL